MMQSDAGGGAAPSNPSASGDLPTSDTGGAAAAASAMADKAKQHISAVGSQVQVQVQGFAGHPVLPVVCRAWIFLFSLLSWTITASLTSLGSASNFQLAVGVIIWIFSIFWLVVEVSILKAIDLPIGTGTVWMNRVEIFSDAILAFLAFGSACSVSGVTTALCDFFDFPTGGECKKYIASNVFMWFTWLVQVIPLVVFTAPAIAKAGDSQDGTVLRTALQTRA
eukprot:CAMPEP_0197469814 /NCGR_PEP_ID=MMETSP1309-20131121/306_1 /TAXON_ID=464262 /ORGANISM="Genus nov. species nov., Strain RCC998" /LENGTH=222 /DNA_ID=CAMNT_0043006101 /DNA_START=68 /DNA_END=736 /DNA_ORIENTATION=+